MVGLGVASQAAVQILGRWVEIRVAVVHLDNENNCRVAVAVARQVEEQAAVVRPLAWAVAALNNIDSTIVGSNTTSCTVHRVADCNSWHMLMAG